MERKFKDVLDELRELKKMVLSSERRQKEFYSVEEAAWYLGMSKSTLYKHTSTGEIPYYKPNGKLIVFSKGDLKGWLTKNRIVSNEELNEKMEEENGNS